MFTWIMTLKTRKPEVFHQRRQSVHIVKDTWATGLELVDCDTYCTVRSVSALPPIVRSATLEEDDTLKYLRRDLSTSQHLRVHLCSLLNMANFATLDSIKKKGEEEKDKGNAYYAGGARGAGQGGR